MADLHQLSLFGSLFRCLVDSAPHFKRLVDPADSFKAKRNLFLNSQAGMAELSRRLSLTS